MTVHVPGLVQIHEGRYNTVRAVPKLCRKIPHCQNSSEIMQKNTTLSEQFRYYVEKYHTIRTVQNSCRKIPHFQNSSVIMQKNTTLSEQFRNHVKIYQTVRKIPKSCSKILEPIQTRYSNTQMHDSHVPGLVQIHEGKYNTVRAVPKLCRKIPH